MTEYVRREGTINVPHNTGVDGLLHAVRSILHRPRVQSIGIDAAARVHYVLYAPDDGRPEEHIEVDFEQVTPSYVVRLSEVKEVESPVRHAAGQVGAMFSEAAKDQMSPVAFVAGTDSHLWDWFRRTAGYSWPSRNTFYGLPLLLDRAYEKDMLLMCAGYGRDASFVDTRVCYRITMQDDLAPETVVDQI